MENSKKMNDFSAGEPQVLRKAEIARILNTVKQAPFNADNSNNSENKSFKKRSLLDIALNAEKDDSSEASIEKDLEQPQEDLQNENISTENNETQETKNELDNQNNFDEENKKQLIEENNALIEERIKKAEQEAFLKGKEKGLEEGKLQGISEARAQSQEGLDAAISVFRIAAETIDNSDQSNLDILNDTNDLYNKIPALEDLNYIVIQREVHTLKARYATLGMKFASTYLHMVEDELSLKKGELVRNTLNHFRGELSKHLKRHAAIVQAAKKTMVDDGLAIPVNKIMDLIKEIPNYEDFHFHIYKNYFLSDLLLKINRYKGLAQEIASGQGKSVIWENEGEKIIVDTEKYGPFVNSLVHVFRNMIDHGIESEDERIEKQKGKSGVIKVQSKVNGESFELKILDDGRGIDPNQVKKQLIKKGLKEEEDLSGLKAEEMIQFIFLPNFSTKEEVSHLSGRGIGMDAVRAEVEKLGGEIKVSSTLEEGTSVIFELPILI